MQYAIMHAPVFSRRFFFTPFAAIWNSGALGNYYYYDEDACNPFCLPAESVPTHPSNYTIF